MTTVTRKIERATKWSTSKDFAAAKKLTVFIEIED
jgi:hypothetical protein